MSSRGSCFRGWAVPSVTEVRHRGAAAHAFHPEVLDAGENRVEIGLGYDHLRGERFVDPVSGPIEIGEQDDVVISGRAGLAGLACLVRALEGRRSEQLPSV